MLASVGATIPNLNTTSSTFANLTVTNSSILGNATATNVTTGGLSVTGASVLANVTATNLMVTGTSYFNIITATTLNISGQTNLQSTLALEYLTYSDARLKSNITELHGMLDVVSNMKSYIYDMNKNNMRTVGFIAQQLEEIGLGGSTTNSSNVMDMGINVIHENEEGTKLVNYIQVVPILAQSIKELRAHVDTRYDELNEKFDMLYKKLHSII
jgi:hypothetical protein